MSTPTTLEFFELTEDWQSEAPAMPSTPRAHALQVSWWHGVPYLFMDDGNGLRIYDISFPLAPQLVDSITFACFDECPTAPVGDHDWMHRNFSVCDDCRYGAAQLWLAGTVLFDLGTGSQPAFTAIEHYDVDSADVEGIFTFSHLDQQFLVATDHPGGCGSGSADPQATLFKLDGISGADLTNLQCLETDPGDSFHVQNGLYLPGSTGTYVYLLESTTYDVDIYGISGAGDTLQLSYVAQPFKAYSRQGSAIRADLDSDMLVTSIPSGSPVIYDISDPGTPAALSSPGAFDAYLGGAQVSRVAISSSLVWFGVPVDSEAFTFDITDPSNPVPFYQSFWDPANPWNSYDYLGNYDAVLSPDGSALYLARHSVLEVISTGISVFFDDFESGDTSKWSQTAQ
jgi:hypothetical protein